MRNHTVVVGYGTKGKTAVAAMIGDEAAQRRDRRRRHRPGGAGPRRPPAWSPCTATPTGRRAAAGRRAARHGDRRRHQQRPDRRAGDADRARARAQGQDHRLDPRGREPASAAAVGRGLGRGVLGDRGAAARHGDQDAQRGRDDRGPADPRRRLRDRRARRRAKEVGGSARHLPDIVLGVVRDGQLLRVDDPEVDAMEPGDRLLYIRSGGSNDDAWISSCATCRCCRGSAPTAPTQLRTDVEAAVAGWADALLLRVDSAQPGADLRRAGGAR